jgi:uncharacterized membrane protein YhaH (DUF805 family)
MTTDLNRLYFSSSGRSGRGQFWLGLSGLALVGILAGLTIGMLFGPLSAIAEVLVFAVQLALAYPAYSLMAKRFQDRGRGRNYAAVAVGLVLAAGLLTLTGLTGIPPAINSLGDAVNFVELVIAFWILIDLGIKRGTAGPNQFGPDPAAAK